MRLLAVAAAGLALAGAAAAAEAPPTPSDVEDEIVCPTCETTLDQSDAPIARRMKAIIRERIEAGDSKAEIKARLVDEFGERVLASPPREGFNLLAWWLPLGGALAGAIAVGLLAWRWSRARAPAAADDAPPPAETGLEPELERRLDDELARFDA